MNQIYTISELANEFDITTRAIRFYEEKGLLQPRREGQNRLYNSADRVKLKLILRGKRLGFSLDESREVIAMYDPISGNKKQLQRLMSIIREKRVQLEQQMSDIESLLFDLREVEQKALAALAEGHTDLEKGAV